MKRRRLPMLLLRVSVKMLPLSLAFLSLMIAGSTHAEMKMSLSKIDPVRLGKEIHRLVNDERRERGLPVLKWSEDLGRIALSHSEDMAGRDYFSHEDPQGNGFLQRCTRAGYACSARVGSRTYLGAENIAMEHCFRSVVYRQGSPLYEMKSERDIASSVVRLWMKSRGHRDNILGRHFRVEGIGVAVTGDGRVYVTQNFC